MKFGIVPSPQKESDLYLDLEIFSVTSVTFLQIKVEL
jgi:hypothetical protein